METTKLNTIASVNRALDVELGLTGAEHRALKPAQRRQRAARLADLHEIRVGLFRAKLANLHYIVVSAEIEDIATAIARAIDADLDSVKFWRTQAGAR